MKSGNLNFLEHSGPLQACNGTDLSLFVLDNGKIEQKNIRDNWQDLQNAMSVVRTGRLSTNAAGIHYKVRRRTLRAYMAENKQSKSKLGRKSVL